MTSQTQLGPAVASDLDAILALERATANAPHWPLSSYAAILEAGEQRGIAPHRCLFVARRGTLFIGFAVGLVNPARPSSQPEAACLAELESVVVASAAGRSGIGRALCNAVLEWCSSQGATEVILEVRAASAGAIALYAGLGFVQTGRRPGYYRDPDDDAVVMLQVADADADGVGDDAFDGADGGHFQAAGPPGADGDQGLGGADGEVGGERDNGRNDNSRQARHEEERQHRDECADGGGERAGCG